ncbi:hypothetical protein N7474_010198 [Penicillium riverlandense]|uniref:uncharacterized protein n=1 Tax=Penicillium riverlandense TaxID=1903569 RepID=UPI002548CEF0|nr:uncharacterized protein N7474_010198 [Penicillium riverlandense]KAJ5808929.1 hypothetical protein N7474_010198 [Penicillium riverlandense]
MARLNEIPAPMESIDACESARRCARHPPRQQFALTRDSLANIVKRRFVRQNREIARVNSMQSLRIRSLESEVTHLLSENVSLREQVITLSQDIERLESAKTLRDGVYEIKSKLDAKLAELSALTTDLGMLPRKVGKLCDERPESTNMDRPKSTAPETKPRVMEPEEQGGCDDRKLPAILEDKYYPRRTLELQELRDLVDGNSSITEWPRESTATPAQRDAEEEPPSVELPELSPDESQIDQDTADDSDPFLPPILETRKKKKKSESSIARQQPSPSGEPTPTLKSGAKRKFSPEQDGGFTPGNVSEDDEFQFSRSSRSPQKQIEPLHSSPTQRPVQMKTAPANLGRRKVLEPKSANTNLGSPRKARPSPLTSKPKRREENENSKPSMKGKELETKDLNPKAHGYRSGHVPTKEKHTIGVAGTQGPIQIQPAPPQESTEITLDEESITALGEPTAGSRSSRRRGAVVSYAEPNLRDKMRRPTSELIDAVGGKGNRRSSAFQAGRESLSEEGEWHSARTLPADLALADQDPSAEQLLAMVSRRKRKVSSTKQQDDPFDMGDSLADLSTKGSKEALAAARQTRRHSSNPKTTGLAVSPGDVNVKSSLWAQSAASRTGGMSPASTYSSLDEDGDTMNMKQVRRGHRVAARRKSMML